MRDAFSSYHPVVTFSYFMLVLILSVVSMHPVCLVISLVCALSYNIYLNGINTVRKSLAYIVPLMLITALINPLFSHEGVTILFYLKNGNPVTAESIYYGLAAATMMAGVLNWFSCYNLVMTTDRFMCVFGKITPAIALMLSMTMRFVPRFKAQIKKVSQAQKCIGRDASNGNFLEKVKHGLLILSIMVTWSLENAIDTADSMKSRGYGLPGRTSYTVYSFDKRDKAGMLIIIILVVYIVFGMALGELKWRFFPNTSGQVYGVYTISLYICYFALCSLPLIINLEEECKWNILKSKN